MVAPRLRPGTLALALVVGALSLQSFVKACPQADSATPDEVIVRVDNARPEDLALLEEVCGASSHRRLFRKDIWLLELPPGSEVGDTIERLEELERVEYAHRNVVFHLLNEPSDPRLFLQWHLDQPSDADIDAPEAWDIHTDSSDVIVAVLDSGVNYDHPDLADNVWRNADEIPGNGIDDDGNGYVDDIHGYDFANDDGDPRDDFGHGTIVAGVVGAVTDNGLGVAGVPWNVQIMPVKVFAADGHPATLADIVLGIEYAMDNGAHLSSNSWGGYWPHAEVQAIEDAIHAAWVTSGMLFVAAAGNNTSNNDLAPFYPASFTLPEVVSVASTGRTDALSSFSNYGLSSVDLGAPGEDIYSTLIGGTYGWGYGTSMACPLVAGAVALLKSRCPQRDLVDIKNQIMSTVDSQPTLQGKTLSGGRLNLHRAVLEFDCDFPPGVGFCFGDLGSSTPCPCGNHNDGSIPGSGCANGVFASGAQLTATGFASVANDTFVLHATNQEPNNSGLYFQGITDMAPGLIWGDGLRCTGGDIRRLQIRFADATGASSTTIPIASKGGAGAGDTRYYQCWYRNPLHSPCGYQFNTSNGYAVSWIP